MLLDHKTIIINIQKYLSFIDCRKPVCKKWTLVHSGSREFSIFRGVREFSLDKAFSMSCEMDNIKIINFFIEKGAKDWNEGLYISAIEGHEHLVKMFIERGANNIDISLLAASEENHRSIINLLMEDKISHWNMGLMGAAYKGHLSLIDFFIEKGANNWEGALCSTCEGYYEKDMDISKYLVKFFIKKGARYFNPSLIHVFKLDHPDFIDFLIKMLLHIV